MKCANQVRSCNHIASTRLADGKTSQDPLRSVQFSSPHACVSSFFFWPCRPRQRMLPRLRKDRHKPRVHPRGRRTNHQKKKKGGGGATLLTRAAVYPLKNYVYRLVTTSLRPLIPLSLPGPRVHYVRVQFSALSLSHFLAQG